MKLRKAQKVILLTWIAEGLETDEINQRAAKFRPRFKVTRQQVDHYRKTRAVSLEEIKESEEVSALKIGLALKEIRVEKLNLLGERLLEDLLGREDSDRLWLDQVKGIGSHDNYERIEYQEFNKSEVDALRGVLDDIAVEVGDRIKKVDATSDGKPLQLPTEQIAQRVASLLELAKKRKEENGI